MKLHRIIRRRIRSADGSSVGDLNSALAINVGEAGKSSTSVSSHQRIVQRTRDGKTETTISESPQQSGTSDAAEQPKEKQ